MDSPYGCKELATPRRGTSADHDRFCPQLKQRGHGHLFVFQEPCQQTNMFTSLVLIVCSLALGEAFIEAPGNLGPVGCRPLPCRLYLPRQHCKMLILILPLLPFLNFLVAHQRSMLTRFPSLNATPAASAVFALVMRLKLQPPSQRALFHAGALLYQRVLYHPPLHHLAARRFAGPWRKHWPRSRTHSYSSPAAPGFYGPAPSRPTRYTCPRSGHDSTPSE